MVECPSPDSIRATARAEHGHLPGGLAWQRRRSRPAAHWLAAAVAVVFGLAACGGNDDEPAAATDLAINAANAGRVAAEAIFTFDATTFEFNGLASDSFVLDGAPSGLAVRSKLLRLAPAGRKVQPKAVTTDSSQCAISGQSTTTVSQAVSGKRSVGDFVEQQFAACFQDVDFELAGKAREVVSAVNAAQTIFTAQGEMTGFGQTEDGLTGLVSGPYSIEFDRSNAALVKISASVDKTINVERRINQQANAAFSVTALKRTSEADIVAGGIAFTFGYTVSGSFPALGSVRLQVNTPDKFAILGNGDFSGAIKVTGASNSSVLLTFLAPAPGDNIESVRLDVDANGDGTIDQTQTKTLGEILLLVLQP